MAGRHPTHPALGAAFLSLAMAATPMGIVGAFLVQQGSGRAWTALSMALTLVLFILFEFLLGMAPLAPIHLVEEPERVRLEAELVPVFGPASRGILAVLGFGAALAAFFALAPTDPSSTVAALYYTAGILLTPMAGAAAFLATGAGRRHAGITVDARRRKLSVERSFRRSIELAPGDVVGLSAAKGRVVVEHTGGRTVVRMRWRKPEDLAEPVDALDDFARRLGADPEARALRRQAHAALAEARPEAEQPS